MERLTAVTYARVESFANNTGRDEMIKRLRQKRAELVAKAKAILDKADAGG